MAISNKVREIIREQYHYACGYCGVSEMESGNALLHPHFDEFNTHIVLLPNNQLTGLTPRGWFHIEWLRLNRPQLIALQSKHNSDNYLRQLVEKLQVGNRHLRQLLASQEQELKQLRERIRQLLGNGS